MARTYKKMPGRIIRLPPPGQLVPGESAEGQPAYEENGQIYEERSPEFQSAESQRVWGAPEGAAYSQDERYLARPEERSESLSPLDHIFPGNVGGADTRREMWGKWYETGKKGLNPDELAQAVATEHGTTYGSGYTNWSSGLAIKDLMANKAAAGGGAEDFVKWLRPDRAAVVAQDQQLRSTHAEANRPDNDTAKMLGIFAGVAGGAGLLSGVNFNFGIGDWVQQTFGEWGKTVSNLFSGGEAVADAANLGGGVTEAAVASPSLSTANLSPGATNLTQATTGLSASAPDLVNLGNQAMLENVAGSGAVTAGQAGGGAAAGGGIINKMLTHPLAISTAMQVVGGALMEPGRRSFQEGLLNRRIQADKELQTQRVQDAATLEEWKRRFTQGGSYFDANVNLRPSGKALLRPDGTPVFKDGIINSEMRPR